ncbi:MAG: hypothetical protein WCV92_02650 [Candidatus Buchananbacteria bacterium]
MDKIKNLKIKFKDFEKEVEVWFTSSAVDAFIHKISDLYHVDYDGLWDIVIMLIENDFFIGSIEKDIAKKFNVDQYAANDISKDLIGMIFYPIAQYIKEFYDIEAELKSRNSSGGAYAAYTQRCALIIDGVAQEYLINQIEIYQKQGLLPEEIDEIKSIFKNSLVDLLRVQASESIAILNANVIFVLHNKHTFKEELLRIILQNQEILTTQQFKLEGKTVSATIENWLKDFTIKNPANALDNIAISDYMVSSSNTSLLSEKEKKLVNNLLLLYRNIKGFPQFFAKMPIEQWQIIPIEFKEEKQEAPKIIEKSVKGLPFTKEQIKNMTAFEKMVAMQEYGLDEEEWDKLIS